VKSLGGTITVHSRPSHGTIVQILLPGAGESRAESQGRIAAAWEERRAARGTILVVEDEETLRLAISTMLRKEGFTVLEAAGGSEALEMVRSHMDDLTAMFLDVALPGIASPEVLREAKRLRPELRVILTSAYGEEKVSALFTGLGSHSFLRKPYRLAELLELLR
jgi:CheY-like chemotaxis protein